MLRLRWLILLATKDYKEAYIQGEELVKLDTSFADTTYFIRTSIVYASDSQYQKSAEFAAKGLAKFPGQPSLTYQQIVSLRSAGQNQQALDALTKALEAKIPVENGSYIRLTLLKDLNRTEEVLPAARAIIAAGDTTNSVRQMIVGIGQAQSNAAGKSANPDDFQTAINTLMYADSVSKGQTKAQAQFLLGSTYVRYSQVKLQLGQAQKSCTLLKEAKNLLADAQIQLPKGGSFAVDQMRTLMGAAMQLDTGADQLLKQFSCK